MGVKVWPVVAFTFSASQTLVSPTSAPASCTHRQTRPTAHENSAGPSPGKDDTPPTLALHVQGDKIERICDLQWSEIH